MADETAQHEGTGRAAGQSGEHSVHIGPDGLHHWRVAAGILERDGQILLVENLRRDGRTDWSTPGGVVEAGEDVLAGLTREVIEETGIEVSAWTGPLYTVATTAVDMRWHLEVEVFVATAWQGEPGAIDDPDDIVVQACFVTLDEVPRRLLGTPAWVHEPLLGYLTDRPAPGGRHCYQMTGTDVRSAVVTRIADPTGAVSRADSDPPAR